MRWLHPSCRLNSNAQCLCSAGLSSQLPALRCLSAHSLAVPSLCVASDLLPESGRSIFLHIIHHGSKDSESRSRVRGLTEQTGTQSLVQIAKAFFRNDFTTDFQRRSTGSFLTFSGELDANLRRLSRGKRRQEERAGQTSAVRGGGVAPRRLRPRSVESPSRCFLSQLFVCAIVAADAPDTSPLLALAGCGQLQRPALLLLCCAAYLDHVHGLNGACGQLNSNGTAQKRENGESSR